MRRLGVAAVLSFLIGVAAYGWIIPYSLGFDFSPIVFAALIAGQYFARKHKAAFIALCCIGFFFSGVQRRAIYSETKSPLEEKIEDWGSRARSFMQRRLEESIENEEDRAIANAILLGDKSRLDRKTKEAFRNAGISHTLALSGMHVGIIWGIVCALFSFSGRSYRSRRVALALSISAIMLYAVCTGLSPSVSRACIMISLWKLCELFSGSKDRVGPILVSAMVIALFNPTAVENISFQLSFAAIAGIAFIYPAIDESIRKVLGKKKNIAARFCSATLRVAGVSMACQIATFPLILLYFGKISGNFLLSNLVAAPLVAFSVYGSAISAALGGIPHLGSWAGEVASLIIEFFREAVQFLGS